MSTKHPDHWELFNSVSRQRITDLPSAAVMEHLASIDPEEQAKWFAWRIGMAEWMPGVQLDQLMKVFAPPVQSTVENSTLEKIEPVAVESEQEEEHTQVLEAAQIEPVQHEPTQLIPTQLIPTQDVSLQDESIQVQAEIFEPSKRLETPAAAKQTERRKHARHKIRTKVVIVFNGQAFRSYSKDISMGGLLLANPIPWSFNQSHCSVFISNPHGGQAIEFTGRVLSSPKDPLRVEFHNPSQAFLAMLAKWLQAVESVPLQAVA